MYNRDDKIMLLGIEVHKIILGITVRELRVKFALQTEVQLALKHFCSSWKRTHPIIFNT